MRALLLSGLQRGQRRPLLCLKFGKPGTERLRLSAINLSKKEGRTTP
jgi:hypothetical protein